MNSSHSLTESDKLKLQTRSKQNRKAIYIFSGITAVASIVVAGGFVLMPESTWPSIAILFVLLFAFGTFFSWRENNKITTDLQWGIKERVSGVITRKQIRQGRASVSYDMDTLHRVALRLDEQEQGLPITRYGVLDQEIDRATSHWYGVEINNQDYNIGVRDYLKVKEGDTIELEIAPRSRVVLLVARSVASNLI